MNPKPEAVQPKLSGYYCYDEKYLKIDGKRFYRINLIDSIINKPVRESIELSMEVVFTEAVSINLNISSWWYFELTPISDQFVHLTL